MISWNEIHAAMERKKEREKDAEFDIDRIWNEAFEESAKEVAGLYGITVSEAKDAAFLYVRLMIDKYQLKVMRGERGDTDAD